MDPIKRLVDVAEHASNGDLRDKIQIYTNDEIGTLSNSFNLMMDNLKSMIGNIKGVSSDITRETEEVTERTKEISSVSGEVAKCFCHELDHLNGILFTDLVTEYIK